MSLNPSNRIAAQSNPGKKMFRNLACPPDVNDDEKKVVDEAVVAELKEAVIPVIGPYEFLRDNKEVPAAYMGELAMWGFRRAWYYWVAEGPGVPPDFAEELHKTHGTQCRVNGNCTAPAPLAANHGFAVGLYHIDTQEGLNTFAAMLKKIYRE